MTETAPEQPAEPVQDAPTPDSPAPSDPVPEPAPTQEPADAPSEPEQPAEPAGDEPAGDEPPRDDLAVAQATPANHHVRLGDVLESTVNFFARNPQLDRALLTELTSAYKALEHVQ